MNATEIEENNSLGLGERYYQPLQQKHCKVKSKHPQVPPEAALMASVKALKDTLGTEGIVPSALVFGEYRQVFTRSETPSERASIL